MASVGEDEEGIDSEGSMIMGIEGSVRDMSFKEGKEGDKVGSEDAVGDAVSMETLPGSLRTAWRVAESASCLGPGSCGMPRSRGLDAGEKKPPERGDMGERGAWEE